MRSNSLPLLVFMLGLALPVQAQNATTFFQGADLDLGQRLIVENKCQACHASKVGGDGSAIYKPQGRISTAAFLRGMVEQCNTELGFGLFPEEVHSIAAVLNRDFYKFSD